MDKKSELIEFQFDQLLRELSLIREQKWPLANRDGAEQMRQLFDRFAELFDESGQEELDSVELEWKAKNQSGAFSHDHLNGNLALVLLM